MIAVQAVRFGEVAPVLGHAAEEGPQGQAALRGLGSVIAAYLEDRSEIPGAERQIERRASEQGCPPVVSRGVATSLLRQSPILVQGTPGSASPRMRFHQCIAKV